MGKTGNQELQRMLSSCFPTSFLMVGHDWQFYPKTSSTIFPTPLDRPAVDLGYLFCYSQAQADTFGFSRNERLEQSLGNFLRRSGAVVEDLQYHFTFILGTKANPDLPTRSGCLHGIAEHIQYHVPERAA